jgi:very-short-patch-repair endonuclease
MGREINEEKFNKKMQEVEVILFAQNRLDEFREEINKIKNDKRLRSKYYKYNVNEMLMQLELNMRGWKLRYQYRDLENHAVHDFYLEPFRLDIEIDEKHHLRPDQKEKDKLRDTRLGQRRILRIPETVLRSNLKLAADLIVIKIIRDRDYWLTESNIEYLAKCGIDFKPYVKIAKQFRYL